MHQTAHIRKNIEKIKANISKINDKVKLIAVTKNFTAEYIIEAIRAGIEDLGENKLQEAIPKIDLFRETGYGHVSWHFIGHLQSNKAGKAAKYFDVIQSVDSLIVARKINEAAAQEGKIIPVLLEYKTSEEKTKFGALEKEITEMADGLALYNNIKVKGIMTIAPYFDEPEKARPYFRTAKMLLEKLKNVYKGGNFDLTELSMGMTGDYMAAIEEGATMVRIGTGIFGKREY